MNCLYPVSKQKIIYVILCIFIVAGKYATNFAGVTSDVTATTSDNEVLMQS